MDLKKRNLFLNTISILGVISLVTAIYLFLESYIPGLGSVCDFTSKISCSAVSASNFSRFFGVPLSFLGILWGIFLIFLSQLAKKRKGYMSLLLLWSIVGMVSVVYFIILEFVIGALCPLCTIVHLVSLLVLVLAIKAYKTYSNISLVRSLFRLKKFLVVLILINLLPFLIFNVSAGEEERDLDSFAQCLTDEGLVLYSSSTCSHCIQQENLFGASFEYITRVECNSNEEDTQIDLCIEMGIQGTPTWLKEVESFEVDRMVGYQSLEELAEWSGCALE